MLHLFTLTETKLPIAFYIRLFNFRGIIQPLQTKLAYQFLFCN